MPRCGCDCRNRTVDAYYGAHDWPCCDTFPDGVPCRYAAIFECSLNLSLGYYGGGQQITCPVLELRKACYFGCEYVAATENANAETCDNLPSLTDATANAMQGTFPPTSDDAGVWTYHDGDYRTTPATDPSETGITCVVPETWDVDHWTLDISLDPPTLTYTNSWALGLLGRTAAVYEALDAWDEFGRNTMSLTEATVGDWPDLPRRICVVALDDPGINNPCSSHAEQCTCCDPGTDEASIAGNFSNCGRLSGELTWTGTRYKSPTPLPSGVSYPASAPCGVFWGTIGSGGDGCTVDGVTWSGSVGLMTYCDGETWAGKAYCYNTNLEEWVEQGDLTISNIECRCGGVYFDVALPPLDCCCDGGELIVTGCCVDGIQSTVSIEFQTVDAPVTTLGSGTLTYDSGTEEWTGTVTFCGSDAGVTLTCELIDGVYRWHLFTSNGFDVDQSGASCDPLELVFQTILSSGDCFGVQVAAYVT